MYHHQFQYAWLKVHEKETDSGDSESLNVMQVAQLV